MRLSTPTAALCTAACALTASANPGLMVLSPLASSQSSSPLYALQTGFSQYEGLLSPATYALLAGRLAVLPARSTSLSSPLQKAFAAAQLAVTEADQATLNDAQACLTDILARGSIPEGYACVDQGKNTPSRYRTATNTVLEQFVGIVPPSTMTVIQDDLNGYFASLGLIPPANDLNTHIQNVLASVTASTSGETVTAVEGMQDCLTAAVVTNGVQQNYQCFVGQDGPTQHTMNIFHGMLQQFVGYLPPNVVQDIINIYSFYLSSMSAVPGLALMQPMNNALLSITAAVSGNTVTAIQQLAQCMNDVAMLQTEEERDAYTCIVGATGPLMTTQVLVNGIVQQGFGYLPPTLVVETERQLRPTLASDSSPSSGAVSSAFDAAFKATDAGPEFTTCYLALEDCVNASILAGSKAECTLTDKCKALAQA